MGADHVPGALRYAVRRSMRVFPGGLHRAASPAKVCSSHPLRDYDGWETRRAVVHRDRRVILTPWPVWAHIGERGGSDGGRQRSKRPEHYWMRSLSATTRTEASRVAWAPCSIEETAECPRRIGVDCIRGGTRSFLQGPGQAGRANRNLMSFLLRRRQGHPLDPGLLLKRRED